MKPPNRGEKTNPSQQLKRSNLRSIDSATTLYWKVLQLRLQKWRLQPTKKSHFFYLLIKFIDSFQNAGCSAPCPVDKYSDTNTVSSVNEIMEQGSTRHAHVHGSMNFVQLRE
ncbi:unnamed protein product [Ixodes pacificus]